jgi:hypothetical protein
MRVERDEARFELSPDDASTDYWDYVCERRVQLFAESRLRRYVDFVRPGARRATARRRLSRRRIELNLNGLTRYAVAGGLRRTVAAVDGANGSAFEWVALLSRYGGTAVSLSLSRKQADALVPFGSVTDLSTGRERPMAIAATADEWRLVVSDCAPRTLLRIYWPLMSSTDASR